MYLLLPRQGLLRLGRQGRLGPPNLDAPHDFHSRPCTQAKECIHLSYEVLCLRLPPWNIFKRGCQPKLQHAFSKGAWHWEGEEMRGREGRMTVECWMCLWVA